MLFTIRGICGGRQVVAPRSLMTSKRVPPDSCIQKSGWNSFQPIQWSCAVVTLCRKSRVLRVRFTQQEVCELVTVSQEKSSMLGMHYKTDRNICRQSWVRFCGGGTCWSLPGSSSDHIDCSHVLPRATSQLKLVPPSVDTVPIAWNSLGVYSK